MPNLSLRKLWRRRSVTISEKDPSYKVVYLGNVLTGWAKGEGCVDKPLSTLWRNYCQSNRSDIVMKITICGSGLQAVTREHGLTEYWAHRITYCGAHPAYPKVFCWVYRHEGRRLKQELRCHAVLCHRSDKAQVMAVQLKDRLAQALHEFRREKVVRQNARLSLVHAIYDNATLPTRKVLLSTGTANYRPPLERSKSAPKLGSIEETIEEEDEEEDSSLEEDEIDARHRNVKCSPVGSIGISETMSDIVHYNSNNAGEQSSGFSRSASQKSHKSKRDKDPAGEETQLPTRASNISTSNNTITDTNSTPNSCVNSNSDSGSSHNSNSHSNPFVSNTSSNSSNINNKSSKYVYSLQLSSRMNPVVQRRFIRSISVDTTLDHDDDIDDFDDDDNDESPIINDKDILRLSNNISSSDSSLRNNPKHHHHHLMVGSCDVPASCDSLSTTDSTEEERSSSVTSTDTTDTVLDRPLSTEDAINNITLINSLSHSLTRQLSLPSDAQPPEESLTSDQPESLGSHCDSCGSSCGGCSDAGGDGNHPEDLLAGGAAAKDRLLGLVVGVGGGENLADLGNLSSLSADAEEPDNISEESGYAEEKDFLQNAELAKALNA